LGANLFFAYTVIAITPDSSNSLVTLYFIANNNNNSRQLIQQYQNSQLELDNSFSTSMKGGERNKNCAPVENLEEGKLEQKVGLKSVIF